mmetsp:Transcript_24034/g.49615  ORF Transcript_24034/g.49615 Transcript_24034/m.49615 type:complete len:532 (-) Transcript_24034:86-1681(-)|eukprot:CAMPEP_0178646744 /NCGR_PEP_ID=MMETSP0698-20121128/19540_1 /TAXON_ID=265572 /ORGANISM="Extubocellulus spinifer, Strain CCMP396" /LENGTH=531 /DNA_ID=CAMNT_0020287925 /DNA_START=233 /DNA_END=1828 /DNA_ORIENTATION=-
MTITTCCMLPIVLLCLVCFTTTASSADDAANDSDPAPTCDHYINRGVHAFEGGNITSAISILRQGSEVYPNEATIWNNLAVAFATQFVAAARPAVTSSDDFSTTGTPTLGGVDSSSNTCSNERNRLHLYCEAASAATIALRLGHSESQELLLAIQSVWDNDGNEGDGDDGEMPPTCPHYLNLVALTKLHAIRKQASNARRGGSVHGDEYLDAVRTACTAETLTVQLSNEEIESRVLWASTLYTITAIFDACGVVMVENLFAPSQIDDAARAQAEHYYERESATADGHLGTSGVEMKRRGDTLRKEVVCPLTSPFTALSSSWASLRISQQILSSLDIELDTFSYIQSETGSRDQLWHADMDPLFSEDIDEGSLLLPPYGLVMIVPFVDLDETNGPTEFIPGSNLPPTSVEGGDASYWHDPADGTANPDAATVSLEAPRGSAIFFDIRTTHRGKANTSPTARPILYASYFREWFIDRVNFEGRHSQLWHKSEETKDSVGNNRLKKLYSRVDSRRYTKMLEDILIERGVDISTL